MSLKQDQKVAGRCPGQLQYSLEAEICRSPCEKGMFLPNEPIVETEGGLIINQLRLFDGKNEPISKPERTHIEAISKPYRSHFEPKTKPAKHAKAWTPTGNAIDSVLHHHFHLTTSYF